MKQPGGNPEQAEPEGAPRPGEPSLGLGSAHGATQSVRPVVPDYELLQRIGGGAYGEVWLARSVATSALRAAKAVWRHKFEDERPFQREFEGIQKFERISREHPSQLALFHIGRNEAEGYFYYVMELADDLCEPDTEAFASRSDATGPKPHRTITPALQNPAAYVPHTLRADLALGRLPTARVLEIGLALTEALAHLHRHGLVHRDVKPSNVIFVNGRPKLADIGLVTDASDQCSIVGTEGYLPPEGPGTPKADIFSLGKVLYEISTAQDRRCFPDLPPDLNGWPDAAAVLELNEVVLRACAADAQHRYESADAMHKDLARLVAGKSVRRARQVEQRWRVVRRTAAGLTIAAAVLGLIELASRIRQPSPARYDEKRSTNDLANRYFDLGKTHFDIFRGTNFQVASDYFKKAIQADPNFASAYGYLAATYFWEDEPWNPDWKFLPQAKTVALQALALDETLAEPHLALGWYYGMGEWNWSEAEKHDKRAVALNRASPFCHLCYAELLRMAGRTDEALAQINHAKNLDPHSRIINVRLVHYLICARRFNQALDQIDQAIAMEAAYDFSWDRTEIFLALGQTAKALDGMHDSLIADGVPIENVEREVADAKQAVPVEGIKAVWRLRLKHDKQQADGYHEACCYAQLGETDRAFDRLDKLLKAHDTELTFNIMADWMLDPIRPDPRFRDIMKAMNFE
jgi:serine/threonine protein kinase